MRESFLCGSEVAPLLAVGFLHLSPESLAPGVRNRSGSTGSVVLDPHKQMMSYKTPRGSPATALLPADIRPGMRDGYTECIEKRRPLQRTPLFDFSTCCHGNEQPARVRGFPDLIRLFQDHGNTGSFHISGTSGHPLCGISWCAGTWDSSGFRPFSRSSAHPIAIADL